MRIVNHKLVYDYCVQIIALVIIIIQLFHRFGKKKMYLSCVCSSI